MSHNGLQRAACRGPGMPCRSPSGTTPARRWLDTQRGRLLLDPHAGPGCSALPRRSPPRRTPALGRHPGPANGATAGWADVQGEHAGAGARPPGKSRGLRCPRTIRRGRTGGEAGQDEPVTARQPDRKIGWPVSVQGRAGLLTQRRQSKRAPSWSRSRPARVVPRTL